MQIDFSIVEKAGISVSEFARLANVNRSTASLWINNRVQPHVYIHDRIAELVSRIQAAVDTGRLPIYRPAKPADLSGKINNILMDASETPATS